LPFALILAPKMKKRMGTGKRATHAKPRMDVAHGMPRALYMYWAKRGKIAPTQERKKVFAAMAEAAFILYTSMM